MRSLTLTILCFGLIMGLTQCQLFNQEPEIQVKAVYNSELPYARVNSLGLDKEDNLWLGVGHGIHSSYGIMRYEGNKWQLFNDSNSTLPANYIDEITCDGAGDIWAIVKGDNLGSEGTIMRYNGNEWQNMVESDSTFPFNAERLKPHSMEADEEGNIWVAANGLLTYNNREWQWYNDSNSALKSNQVKGLTQGQDGSLWVILDEQGLMQMKGNEWQTHPIGDSDLLNGKIMSMIQDQSGHLWIGTNKGLVEFDPEKGETFEQMGTGSTSIRALKMDNKGGIWASGTMGMNLEFIKYFDGNQWISFKQEETDLPSNMAHDMVSLENGETWLGTSGGLVKVKIQ